MSFGSELGKVAEIANELPQDKEVSSFDPERRVDMPKAGDMDGLDGNIDQNPETFDPDKRIDVNNDGRPDSIQDAPFNPDKRVQNSSNETEHDIKLDEKNEQTDMPSGKGEIDGKSLDEVCKDYINDLKDKSDFPDTIKDLNPDELEVVSPEEVSKKREEFDDKKAQLRKEWEEQNGQPWPKYTEDVKNSDGVVIRHKGDNYDAHHIQPLKLGGENEVSNITPLSMDNHKEVHAKEGSCTKLVEKVEAKQ